MRPVAATALALGLPAWLAAQQPQFPSGVEVVRIDAVVLDGQDRPVEGLRAADFELLEDGRPQAITSFEAVAVRGRVPAPGEVPRPARPTPQDGALFLLFYDDLHLPPSRTAPARDAIRRFLAEAVRPGDRVTVVAPEQEIWWTGRLDEGRDDLLAVADRLQGRRLRGDSRGDYQALLVHQRGEEGFLDRYTPEAVKRRTSSEAAQAQDAAALQQQIAQGGGLIPVPPSIIGGPRHPDLRGLDNSMRVADAEADYMDSLRLNRASLGALRDAVAALALVAGRKSLVVVSEGMVDDPDLGEREEVVDTARRANAAVYFLDVRGLEKLGLPGRTALGGSSRAAVDDRRDAAAAGCRHWHRAPGRRDWGPHPRRERPRHGPQPRGRRGALLLPARLRPGRA